ncbi:MAG: hypothetical protein U1E55_07815 [Paracoccus sp. (in: a-proteobacteria)]
MAYLPALPAYFAGGLSFRDFAASGELTAELIGDVSWFINVMPAIATLRANSGRLTELARAIERGASAGDSMPKPASAISTATAAPAAPAGARRDGAAPSRP